MSHRSGTRSSQHSRNTQPLPQPHSQAMSSAVSAKGSATSDEGGPRLSNSTRVSTTIHNEVTSRDHGCIICADQSGIQVCHIIGRSTEMDYQVHWLWKTSIDRTLQKQRPENLITLCAAHHVKYDHFQIALVPTQRTIAKLKAHEKTDYANREHEVNEGRADPGRTVPNRSNLENYCEFLLLISEGAREFVGDSTLRHEMGTDFYCFFPFSSPVPFGNGPPILDESNASMRLAVPAELSMMALISHALQALAGPYRPLDATVGETGNIYHRVAYFEEELLELRGLYNRRSPTRGHRFGGSVSSTTTVKPDPSSSAATETAIVPPLPASTSTTSLKRTPSHQTIGSGCETSFLQKVTTLGRLLPSGGGSERAGTKPPDTQEAMDDRRKKRRNEAPPTTGPRPAGGVGGSVQRRVSEGNLRTSGIDQITYGLYCI